MIYNKKHIKNTQRYRWYTYNNQLGKFLYLYLLYLFWHKSLVINNLGKVHLATLKCTIDFLKKFLKWFIFNKGGVLFEK